MNALSLAYSDAQKQESWIDDPFDLKGEVTGVTPLSHQRNLTDYALELVGSYAEFINNQYELNVEKLSSPYQYELARLYIESIDREIEWACYGNDESINSDFLCALLAMLKDNNIKTRHKFAQVTSENIIKYYSKTLQEILDTACSDYYNLEMNNAGYSSHYDYEHGDLIWSR